MKCTTLLLRHEIDRENKIAKGHLTSAGIALVLVCHGMTLAVLTRRDRLNDVNRAGSILAPSGVGANDAAGAAFHATQRDRPFNSPKIQKGGDVMKNALRLMLVFMLVLGAASAYAGEATQMWKCEMEEDATEAQVMKGAKDWLAAAKEIKGGENLEATVYFPVAVNDTLETDVWFVVKTPTFEEWGRFWDGYAGSAAEKIDNANQEFVICPDSALWESIKVK